MHTCRVPGGVDDDDAVGSRQGQAQATNLHSAGQAASSALKFQGFFGGTPNMQARAQNWATKLHNAGQGAPASTEVGGASSNVA